VAGKPWRAVSKDFLDIYGVTVGPTADAGPPTEGSPRRKRNQRGDRHHVLASLFCVNHLVNRTCSPATAS
jgi:hypothetical protein